MQFYTQHVTEKRETAGKKERKKYEQGFKKFFSFVYFLKFSIT